MSRKHLSKTAPSGHDRPACDAAFPPRYRTFAALSAAVTGSAPVRRSTAERLESRQLFTTYYVDNGSPAASDRNAGTSLAAPLSTITQALNLVVGDNKAIQSDTVLIRGGVYREQPFVWPTDAGASAVSRTVISAYTNPATGKYEPVYINAADPLAGTWIQDGNSGRWYLPKFSTQTSGVWVDWSGANDGAPLQQIGTYNAGFPDQREITGTGVSDMVPGTYFGDAANNRLYVWLQDGSDPNAHTLEYANRARAIYQPGYPTGDTYTWASHVDFIGLKLRHANVYNTVGQDSDCAIYTFNDERLIDCDVQWNPTTGLFLRGTSQLINCICSNNGRNGLQAQGNGFLISGGQFNNNYWRHYIEGGEAGIKVITNNPTLYGDIRNAEIANNAGKGIWFDTCFQNDVVSQVTGNYIHDNQEEGIDLEASRNFLVANNVIADNAGDGIVVNAVENAAIVNNTIVGNHGVAAVELDGGSRSHGDVYPGMIDTLNNRVENNIIADNYSVYDLDLPTAVAGGDTVRNNTSDHNLFFHNGLPLRFTDGGTYFGWSQTPSTLPGWQSDTAQDTHSIFADPMFVPGGVGAAAYRIGGNSPAVGAGANLTSRFADEYTGSARPNTAFDLGAFQNVNFEAGAAGPAPAPSNPAVWVDDQLPDDAAMTKPDPYANLLVNRFWQWENQSAFSGAVADDSTAVAGAHRQYFYAANHRVVQANDQLFAYVWIDPANLPRQIQFEWQDSSGSWAHQASWGAAMFGAGIDGSVASQHVGSLPSAGHWSLLSVPAATVGLAGKSITGFSFDLYDGRALIDSIGTGAAAGIPVGTANNTSVITGNIYQDKNASGAADAGEDPVVNATVFLDLNGDGIQDAGEPGASTDNAGNYSFAQLPAGTYLVTQTPAVGFVISTTQGAAHRATVGTGATVRQDFGEFPAVLASTANNDAFVIASSADHSRVCIWTNQPESATPTYSIDQSLLSSLAISAGVFNTTLTIDDRNGDPLGGRAIRFDGGAGNDVLAVTGAATNTFDLSATRLVVNSLTVDFSALNLIALSGGAGRDVLTHSVCSVPVSFDGSAGNDEIDVVSGTCIFPADAGAISGAVTLRVSAGAAARFDAGVSGSGIDVRSLAELDIAAGSSVVIDPAADPADRQLLILGALSLGTSNQASQGLLDVGDNDVIVRNGNSQVINGRLAGGGIFSSGTSLPQTQLMRVAMADGPAGTFDGQAVSATDVRLKLTFTGDTNLDGTVDATDFAKIDANAGTTTTGWWNGDFNYDGRIDGSDYTLIDNAMNSQMRINAGTTLAGLTEASFGASSGAVSGASTPTGSASTGGSAAVAPPIPITRTQKHPHHHRHAKAHHRAAA